ncbi:glutathione S-transferase family protein [Pseudomonas sp. PB101]|uniref:glutathione S-transferase family protein n=1 Tax=Pseudomonas sp. PB101 TaxID=2495428 RepID=UPI0013662FDB|nr:glutathione S-transferase family protein [Pseudomonas sp. PB101]MVW84803.1 glutathione S-transferase family protein [Pseudomonas sp. PB101]
MTLELYNASISTCSQRVRFVLAEKGLPYTDHRLRLEQGQHLTPAYIALNPNGLVPTLVHQGDAIIDSSVINEYLEEVFPDIPLLPTHPLERARVRAWVQYLDEVMTPSIRYPSFQKLFGGAIKSMTSEERMIAASRSPLRKHFVLEMGPQGFSQTRLNDAMERIEQALTRMEASLSRSLWIAHDQLTLADIAMMPSIVRLEDLGLASLWENLPGIASWYERLQSRPAFAKTYEAVESRAR